MQPLPVFYPRGYFPPVSNTERQRQFRERNPGYYGRLKAKQRAKCNARAAAILAAASQPEPIAIPVKPVLMLPAPVECPLNAEVNALAERLKSQSTAEPVLIPAALRSRAA